MAVKNVVYLIWLSIGWQGSKRIIWNLDLKRGRAKTYFGPTALKRGRAMARVAPPLPTPMTDAACFYV